MHTCYQGDGQVCALMCAYRRGDAKLTDRKISECKNRHFFVGCVCPWCKEKAYISHPFYEGDCVECGSICAKGVYCCTEEDPMTIADFDHVRASRGGEISTCK